MQDVDKKIIEVTPEAWHALKIEAAYQDRAMYDLASEILLDALKPREAASTTQEVPPRQDRPSEHEG